VNAASLTLDDVACARGGRVLFAGLSCAFGPGDAGVVTGPNGIGKSSLIAMIAGLLPPFAGRIAHGGVRALLSEAAALDPELPLARALGFWAAIDGRGDAVADALAAVDLAPLADVPVRFLSTGQRRRAAMARVIASGAAIWLLDEPANGLDTASVARLAAVIEAHRAAGGIALVATHFDLGLTGTIPVTLAAPDA
jgi:heme exporter protein A